MANNFGVGQDNFSYGGETGSDFGGPALPNTQPVSSRPISAQPPRAPEDIFATVDRRGLTGSPATGFGAPNAARDFGGQTPPAADNLGPGRGEVELPAAVPTSGGSLKYLLIGILTLIVVLAIALSLYFFILKPQFQGSPAPEANTAAVVPAAIDVNQTAVSTETPAAVELAATSTVTAATGSETIIPTNATGTASTAALDSDSDGLTDYDEINLYHSNPNNLDTDGDGLTDYEEVNIYHTDPVAADTDGDGYQDGEEVNNGYNPSGPGRLLIVK